MKPVVKSTLNVVVALLGVVDFGASARIVSAIELGLAGTEALSPIDRQLIPLMKKTAQFLNDTAPGEFRQLGEADRDVIAERLRERVSSVEARDTMLAAALRGEADFRDAMLSTVFDGLPPMQAGLNTDQEGYLRLIVDLAYAGTLQLATHPELIGGASVVALRALAARMPTIGDIRAIALEEVERVTVRPRRVVAGDRPRLPESFVERAELGLLKQWLGSGGAVLYQKIRGMRGVGKSQLASAYSAECENDGWPFVFWVNASSRLDVINQLAAAARSAGVASAEDPSADAAVALVTWLNDGNGEDRLLVFDNVENWDDLREWIPRGDGLRVLFTSTMSVEDYGTEMTLEGFTHDEAVDFLLRGTNLSDRDGASAVAQRLGHLPLALSQATATMKLLGYNFDGYGVALDEYSVGRVLRRSGGDTYLLDVETALRLSIDSVLESLKVRPPEALVASVLLQVLSLLAESGTPRVWSALLGDDALAATFVVGELINHSIVTPSANEEEISLHRPLAKVIRDRLSAEGQDAAAVAAATGVLEKAFEAARQSPSDVKRRALITVGRQLGALAIQPQSKPLLHSPDLVIMAGTVCLYLVDLGDHRSALALKPFLDASDEVLGGSDERTFRNRNYLGMAYQTAGKYSDAVDTYTQNLVAQMAFLDANHPDIMTTQNNLATALHNQGRIREALPHYEAALATRERLLDPDHPDLLSSRNNIGGVYLDLGELDRAISLFEATLEDTRRVQGANHADALGSLNNLAAAYLQAKRFDEAIAMHHEVLAKRTVLLPEDAPDTLISCYNLSFAYGEAGRPEEAYPYALRAFEASERVLGEDHPHTILRRGGLAVTELQLGRIYRAVRMLKANLAIAERALDADDPQILTNRSNLASAFSKAGRFERAVPLLEWCLEQSSRVFGATDPSTFSYRNNLADAFLKTGQGERAVSLLQTTLSDALRTLSVDHPDLLRYRNELASALLRNGKGAAAITQFAENLAVAERTLDPQHLMLVSARLGLASAYRNAGEPCRAVDLARRATAQAESVLGPEDVRTRRAAAERDAAIAECAARSGR